MTSAYYQSGLARGFAAIGTIASVFASTSALSQSGEIQLVDNKWLLLAPTHVRRSKDALRIDVPLGIAHIDFKGPVIYLAGIFEAASVDKSGVRCGSSVGKVWADGLESDFDRKSALIFEPGRSRDMVLSMQCEKPALGDAFILHLNLYFTLTTTSARCALPPAGFTFLRSEVPMP